MTLASEDKEAPKPTKSFYHGRDRIRNISNIMSATLEDVMKAITGMSGKMEEMNSQINNFNNRECECNLCDYKFTTVNHLR